MTDSDESLNAPQEPREKPLISLLAEPTVGEYRIPTITFGEHGPVLHEDPSTIATLEAWRTRVKGGQGRAAERVSRDGIVGLVVFIALFCLACGFVVGWVAS